MQKPMWHKCSSKTRGHTKNKSQSCDTEEIVTWKITGMKKMSALKKIRDRNRPKKVNNKYKHMQISIATKDKASLSYQLFMSFCNIKKMSRHQNDTTTRNIDFTRRIKSMCKIIYFMKKSDCLAYKAVHKTCIS